MAVSLINLLINKGSKNINYKLTDDLYLYIKTIFLDEVKFILIIFLYYLYICFICTFNKCIYS